MKRPVITLLTDFGLADHYAGAMKGVMLGICPDAQLVDISHEITPYAITEAAFTLCAGVDTVFRRARFIWSSSIPGWAVRGGRYSSRRRATALLRRTMEC